MKKITVCFALCVALLLASCGGRDYRNLLPADAFAVVSINSSALAEKAKADDLSRTFFYQLLEESLDEEMPEADRERILALAADPEKTGLDLGSDIFFFSMPFDTASGRFSGGLLGKVRDRDAVKELLDWAGAAGRMTEEGDVTFVRGALADGSSEIIAFDREAFLLFFSTAPDGEAEAAVRGLFAQKRSRSLLHRPELARAFEPGNDIVMMTDYGSLVSQYMGLMGTGMTSVPGMEFLSEMSYVMPVNFEKGRIVADVSVFFGSEAAGKQYREFTSGTGKIDGGFLNLLPGSNLALAAWNMNGARVYEMFERIPMYSMLLAMAPQAQTILKSIDGDVALALHGFDAVNDNPELTLLASTAGEGILKSVLELVPRAEQYGEGVYRLKFDTRYALYFGERDGRFYATTVPCMAASLAEGCADFTDASASKALFRGAYGAMEVDFREVRQLADNLFVLRNEAGSQEHAVAMRVLQAFEKAEARCEKPERGTFVVEMTDKERNAAETIYSLIEELGRRALEE